MSIRSIKYVLKYVTKGCDQPVFALEKGEMWMKYNSFSRLDMLAAARQLGGYWTVRSTKDIPSSCAIGSTPRKWPKGLLYRSKSPRKG